MAGSADELNVFLLGAPRIERNGEPVALRRSKALALLAYLCVEPRPHTRDALLDLLWPLFEPDDARNNLRRELSILRKSLELDVLQVDRATIGIEPLALANGLVTVDVLRFQQLVAAVGKHDHPTDLCPSCVDDLTTAVALYSGDFLAGFSLPDSPAFDEWQFFQNERLRQEASSAFDQLAEWLRKKGDYETAITHARRRLALDPLHEPAHRTLMTLYAESGQQAAALRQFDRVRQVLKDELGLEPETATLEMYDAVHARRLRPPERVQPVTQVVIPAVEADLPAIAPTPHVQNAEGWLEALPADTTPFIGREREIAHLAQYLTDPSIRLLTVIGIGGMGKTRLALAAARHLLKSEAFPSLFADGVRFVPLAGLTDPGRLAAAVSVELKLALDGHESAQGQLVDFLHDRNVLLILDNFEHLATPENLEFLASLMAQGPQVKLLLTSRSKLGVSGEQVFLLDGMPVPETDGDGSVPTFSASAQDDAVALFLAAGRRARPSFSLTDDNIAAVVEICRLVQGMPLGIELAAGWLGLLQPEEILAEIQRSLDFLESDLTDLPERQASIRAVFDSSWRILSPSEREALARMTIFRGGFTREAAEQVTGASLRTLLALTHKSWLQHADNNRYQIHELLRQYAYQELSSSADWSEGLSERHARYYAGMMKSLEPAVKGPKPAEAFNAISYDLENILSGLDWLLAKEEIQLLVAQALPTLFHYLESRYQVYLFRPLLGSARHIAARLGLDAERAVLLIFRTAFLVTGFPTRFLDYPWISPDEEAIVRETKELVAAHPDQFGFWAIIQAWHYGRLVDTSEGVRQLRALVHQFETQGRSWEAAFARQNLGRLLGSRSGKLVDYQHADEARDCLNRSLQEFETLGDRREAAICLYFLGLERGHRDDLDTARRLVIEAQEQLRSLGEQLIAANGYWHLADIYMYMGETTAALQCLHQMAETLRERGRTRLATMALSRESYEMVRYGDLEEALRLRRMSLELSQRFDDPFNIAWDYWEMGEVYRVMDDRIRAREWYERARTRFVAAAADIGHSFYFRGLGDLALADGDFVAADDYFRRSLVWAETNVHPWQMIYAQTGIARAALGNRTATTRKEMAAALQMCLDANEGGGIVLMVLTATAQLLKQKGDERRANELADFILAHPMTWRESRRQAAAILGQTPDDESDYKTGPPLPLNDLVEELHSYLVTGLIDA